MTMTIELAIAFMAGFTSRWCEPVEGPINLVLLERGLKPVWGVYVSFMVTLLWPVLAVITAFTIAYATLRGVRE